MLRTIILFTLFILSACGTGDEKELEEIMINRITPAQARVWIELYPDTIIFDVRSADEFATGHIRGAVNLPLDSIEEHLLPTDKDALILIYCRSGIRSQAAVQKLAQMGFTRVYDFGGILDWSYGITR